MSAKSGTAGTLVTPIDPKLPEEAAPADPGEFEKVVAEQVETKTGRFGEIKLKPHKPPEDAGNEDKPEEAKLSWIEILLKSEDDKPMAGEPYEVHLPSGETVASGTLDDKGFARIEGIDPGNCKVTFPNQEDDQWRKG